MKIPEFPTHSVEHKRIYLLENLPEPLARSDEHWQIFDNYQLATGRRLRRVRIPHTAEWFRAIEERRVLNVKNGLIENVSRIVLDEDGYLDSGWDENKKYEVRKNRYFHENEGREFSIDLVLGELWGIIFAQTVFGSEDEMREFAKPGFALLDISGAEFFRGENLTSATLAEVRSEVAKLMA
jgi:hypothetical protein